MAELGSGNGTGYPAALDTDSTIEVNSPASNKTKANANIVNDLAAAMVATQTELGTDPAGSVTDVKTRIGAEHNGDGTHGTLPSDMTLSGDNTLSGANTFSGGNIGVFTIPSLSRIECYNNTTNNAYQVDVKADLIPMVKTSYTAGSSKDIRIVDFNGTTYTADITASGANGLDTGAEATSTWYYIYLIMKNDGTKASLLSASYTAPTMPSGYTYMLRVGAVYNDSGDNFIDFYQRDNRVAIEKQTMVNASVSTGEQTLDISTFIPFNIVKSISITSVLTYVAGADQLTIYSKQDGVTVDTIPINIDNANQKYNTVSADIAINSTNIYWNQTAANSHTMWSKGFMLW